MFERKGREEATRVAEFRESTQEGFEAFADEVTEIATVQVVVEFRDKPVLGLPYALVWTVGHSLPLVVDEGQALCTAHGEFWVAD
jgi:hypothetical protein